MITTAVHTPMYYYIDDSISSEFIFDAIQEFLWFWFWFGFGFEMVSDFAGSFFLFREFITETIFLRKELIMHQSLSDSVRKWCGIKAELTGKGEYAKLFKGEQTKLFEFVRVYRVNFTEWNAPAPIINFQNWGKSSIFHEVFGRKCTKIPKGAPKFTKRAPKFTEVAFLN